MKIQCSCGAKYVFEATPEMLDKPLRFVCSSCGLDASEYVNNLVREELGQASENPEPANSEGVEQISPEELAPAESDLPGQGEQPRVRISGQSSRLSLARSAEGGTRHTGGASVAFPEQDSDMCAKHYGVPTVAKCYVCGKPLCPKCMELFGYVCSPLCNAKANSHGIKVPIYEGQRSLVESRRWRLVGRATIAVCILLLGLGALWVWYLFWGCLPKPIFSVRFPEMSYSGQSVISAQDQIVFLHGELLARYDIKLNKEIWSRHLGDTNEIERIVSDQLKWYQAWVEKAEKEEREDIPKIPPREKLVERAQKAQAAELVLRVRDCNIWVSSPGKLVRYDWDLGNPIKEVPLASGFGGVVSRGDELLMVETSSGRPVITHINLTNCETRTEEIAAPVVADSNGDNSSLPKASGVSKSRSLPPGGAAKPLDPAKIAEQAQHLSYAAKIALPAVLAVNINQERALAEMNGGNSRPPQPTAPAPDPQESSSLVPTKDGLMQVSVRLIESRMTRRAAMKAAPAKSALDGPLTAGQSIEMANEMLNEMQRSRGGDVVIEDNSLYRVTLRRPGEKEDWTGEVNGPPTFYPLQTVNVLAANKSILVFDKSNKLLWKGPLNYNVSGDLSSLDAANATYGQGPLVEHRGGLYVFDEGVLTAFDLATGNARWRLPSVGITGIFFDDKDMMYVNTTTASPDNLKYSRQIDVSQRINSVVLKLDSKTGKTIWTAEPGGLLNYVSGKYIFTVKMYQPEEPDEDNPRIIHEENRTSPYLRIKRIDPGTGREMWEHFQQRAPLDIQFDRNTIRLVFRKEVQVLRFIAL